MTPLIQPLKWHGGKHYLATKIVALMPPHVHFVSPYVGGASVELAHPPEDHSEVWNDLNLDLTNFWRVLQDPIRFARFQQLCEATPFSEVEYKTANEQHHDPRDDQEKAAWQFFVRCRQSLAGRMKSFAPLSKTRVRRRMNEQASAWLNAVEGLPAVHERLKRVVILNHDALDVIREQDGSDTLYYMDPPYVDTTRAAPDVYAHEMTREQHVDLLRLIKTCTGKVMISGYASELYDDWLKGWTRHMFSLPNNAAGGKEKRTMTECLWCNF